uniref:Putative sulfotransferase n=1 Tax=viral metagenome TaxID=1070528 RepID=A0A6M3J4M8_9ZZZZ
MIDPTTGAQLPDECMNLAPKWLLNGFPKAGLHFCQLMMRPLAIQMPPGQLHGAPFVGTFAGRSWTEEWVNIEQFMYHVSRLRPGHHFYSHIGHQPAIEAFLYYLGVAHVFVIRDLRDVAVSQAHHVWDDNNNLAHPDKELYRDLGSFDKALEACIVGLKRYPGVMRRWSYYAPWVEADWIYQFRFERARYEPETVAREMVTYGVGRAAGIFGYNLRAEGPALDVTVEKMVASAEQRERSITYRPGGGVSGGWKDAFTERHKRLFKETDKDNWLVRLGYAQSDDW